MREVIAVAEGLQEDDRRAVVHVQDARAIGELVAVVACEGLRVGRDSPVVGRAFEEPGSLDQVVPFGVVADPFAPTVLPCLVELGPAA